MPQILSFNPLILSVSGHLKPGMTPPDPIRKSPEPLFRPYKRGSTVVYPSYWIVTTPTISIR